MATTRTIGPLHLEDLEPHRFEDLMRQLVYDFRSWRTLEATGRAGADDGFDARGTEVIGEVVVEQPDDDDEVASVAGTEERIWLVQCKREKAISPKKLLGYLAEIQDPAALYGIIFAAACDFSKTARDRFRDTVREMGISEAHLWGKGEIEDMLFQPKNDHLLFAYFGVSLVTHRRTMKTQIRSKLAMKRKAIRHLQEIRQYLIRDASDDRYPIPDADKTKRLEDRRHWVVLTYGGAFSDGLHFVVHRHLAYLAGDGEEWDFAECMDDGPVDGGENPWYDEAEEKAHARAQGRREAMATWDQLPERTRAWFEVVAVLPYENILDIDENGDECFGAAHIYTSEFLPGKGPFSGFEETLETIEQWGARCGQSMDETRVAIFLRRAASDEKVGQE